MLVKIVMKWWLPYKKPTPIYKLDTTYFKKEWLATISILAITNYGLKAQYNLYKYFLTEILDPVVSFIDQPICIFGDFSCG